MDWFSDTRTHSQIQVNRYTGRLLWIFTWKSLSHYLFIFITLSHAIFHFLCLSLYIHYILFCPLMFFLLYQLIDFCASLINGFFKWQITLDQYTQVPRFSPFCDSLISLCILQWHPLSSVNDFQWLVLIHIKVSFSYVAPPLHSCEVFLLQFYSYQLRYANGLYYSEFLVCVWGEGRGGVVGVDEWVCLFFYITPVLLIFYPLY